MMRSVHSGVVALLGVRVVRIRGFGVLGRRFDATSNHRGDVGEKLILRRFA